MLNAFDNMMKHLKHDLTSYFIREGEVELVCVDRQCEAKGHVISIKRRGGE